MHEAQIVARLLARVDHDVAHAEANPYDAGALDEAAVTCDRLLGLYGNYLTLAETRHVRQLARRLAKLQNFR